MSLMRMAKKTGLEKEEGGQARAVSSVQVSRYKCHVTENLLRCNATLVT